MSGLCRSWVAAPGPPGFLTTARRCASTKEIQLKGRTALGGHEALLINVQPTQHAAIFLVEGLGARGVTLFIVKDAATALAYAFLGSGLCRLAFGVFEHGLPASLGLGTGGRTQ